MKREDLKAMGLTDEQIDKVMAEHGKDTEKFKADLASSTTERDTFKKNLEDANKQIEDFKKVDPAAIQKTADDYKLKFETAQAEAAKALAAVKFDHSLEKALTDAKVKDVVAVKAHLKTDALKLNDDGSLLGLKEQLEPLQKEKGYLFETDDKTPEIVIGGGNKPLAPDAFETAMLKGAGIDTQK